MDRKLNDKLEVGRSPSTLPSMTKDNKMAQAKKLTVKQVKALKGQPTRSAQIRYLTNLNQTRSEIVKTFKDTLGHTIRYQHVRNVQITPVAQPRS